jgi:Zn-dependent protease with chaperone function
MRFRHHQAAAQAGTRRLLLLFALVLVGLTLAVNGAMALAYRLTAPWTSGYPDWFFATNTALVWLYVLGGCAIESMRLREGGAHVARLAGGREARLDDARERRLANVVAEMAIAAHTLPPAAWVLPREDAINAFAAGWTADDAVVAVTQGALERLDRAELQGVVAHEVSHLVHGDTTLNMRLIGLVWGLRLLFDFGRQLTEPGPDGRRHIGLLFGLALMAVGALGWAAGRLLQAAVSRQREFLADASAVKYARLVDGLGGALRKIADQRHMHGEALSARTGALAHLFLVSQAPWTQWARWAVWATHPPLAERIRRLYGRSMPDLPADPLPPPAAAEPLAAALSPALALVPAPAATPVGPPAPAWQQPSTMRMAEAPAARAGAGGPVTPTPGDAGHDRFQVALPTDPAARRRARQAEALARIEHWHSAGELYAALWTLVAPPRAAPAPLAWEGLAPTVVAAMQDDLGALDEPARMVMLDRLATRAAAWPADQRRRFLRASRAAATGPAAALRWLLLRHRLRGRALPFAAVHAGNTLKARRRSARLATAALAAALADASGLGAAAVVPWARAAEQALRVPPLWPATASERETWRAVVRLQRVAALERPRLLRAWLQAWRDDRQLAPSGAASAVLTAVAHLLELPLPPGLTGHGGDAAAARGRAGLALSDAACNRWPAGAGTGRPPA